MEKKRQRQIYDKPPYDMMHKLHEEWMRNPVGTQADFFLSYGWSRDKFFSHQPENDHV